jgi:hypothetical protein
VTNDNCPFISRAQKAIFFLLVSNSVYATWNILIVIFSFSFRPSNRGRGLGAEMFSEVPESDDVPGAFELRGSEVKAAMKQVADCLAALEPKKPQAQ